MQSLGYESILILRFRCEVIWGSIATDMIGVRRRSIYINKYTLVKQKNEIKIKTSTEKSLTISIKLQPETKQKTREEGDDSNTQSSQSE